MAAACSACSACSALIRRYQADKGRPAIIGPTVREQHRAAAGLKDVRGRQTRKFARTHVHVRVRPALGRASGQEKRLGLKRGCQDRQLVVGASPSCPSDGRRPVSKVDIGDGLNSRGPSF